jgi:alpha-galactosidase
MAKLVIIGAGSGFGSRLSVDFLSRGPLREGAVIGLCDINAESLQQVAAYVQRTIDAHGLEARVVASTDRNELLGGADFVVTSVSVGGGAYWGYPFAHEVNIPRKYGVDQSVADTIGPGGVFRFLRTAPVQLAFCKDMERRCPEALLLNHTNPMAMLTWLHSAGSAIRNVGLCHSVQGTSRQLAGYIGAPYEEVSYWVAGINHQAWFLEFRRNGRDAYPQLRKAMEDPDILAKDPVRWEILRHFDYFVTESSHHMSEYVPYFRRTAELRERFGFQSREVRMEQPRKRAWMAEAGIDGQPPVGELKASHEFTTGIMEAVVTNQPYLFNGNVMNDGLVSNLPPGCCVEVPCLADRLGVHPCRVGELPGQLAAINRSNIAVQQLAVEAFFRRSRKAAFQAVALDPLTAAVLPLHAIREMFDEMWQAEKDLLAYFDE